MRLLCIYASVSVSVSNNPSWRTKIHESALRCCLEKGASMSASPSASASPASNVLLSSSPVNVVHSLQVCLSWAVAAASALGFDSVSKTGRPGWANVRMSRLIGFLAVGLGGFLTWLECPHKRRERNRDRHRRRHNTLVCCAELSVRRAIETINE